MAKEIPGLKVGQFKNATHLEVMKDVVSFAEQCEGMTDYFPVIFNDLKAAVQAEGAALQEVQKSQYTEQIAKKDDERDVALIAAKDALRAATGNPVQSVRDAADYLKSMSRLLKTKVIPQYEQQTGEVTIVCDELLGKFAPYTEQAGIKPYIEQLKRLNEEMCQLLQLRDLEKGEQGKSKVAEYRQETDKLYRELVKTVNACELVYCLGKLAGEPRFDPFQDFISYMIGLIDRAKKQILKETGESGEEETEEEESETVTEEETLTRESEKKE